MPSERHSGEEECGAHHGPRHTMSLPTILSTAPQLSVSQKALGTLPDDVNMNAEICKNYHTKLINRMNNWCICWFSRIFLLGILIYKRLTASFGVKGLITMVTSHRTRKHLVLTLTSSAFCEQSMFMYFV
jgi:hypothetical protein